MTAYLNLRKRFARIAALNEAASVVSWDASTMMPDGGAEARGEQMAVLAGLAHELLTHPGLAEDLSAAERPNDEWDSVNLDLMRVAHQRASALPGDLVEAVTKAGSVCETIWRAARPASDFGMVRESLAEVVKLTREAAGILGEALGLSAYDALLTGYQRGILAAEVEGIFAGYEGFLKEVLPQVEALQAARGREALPAGPYPADVQERVCRQLSEAAGLDFHHARLDRSAHPFCGGTPTDVRITNRYDEEDFCAALMGVLHETGHAMYEQGLPKGWRRQLVGEAAGMAAHESQSLMIEMQAVRSDAYLGYLAPVLAEAFGKPITVGGLKGRLRWVERSFIRVEADEMTYPAHVILRFRLEQALIAGELAVADLPGAWNDGFEGILGIRPPDDRRGCLQDIHWHCGLLGYFPTYSLGAMAAAQLMAAARRDVVGLDEGFARGDFSGLLGWLRENVHGCGARLGFNELLRRATGAGLEPGAFEGYLRGRYLD